MTKISNWGNTPNVNANLIPFHRLSQLKEILINTSSIIPRGLGRCYGDSSLNEVIISTTEFNQISSFNSEDGTITCQAGVSLQTILETIIPSGWFLPVTPGSKFVTLGGAVAANVHGKNHHLYGCISNHILFLDILTPSGELIRCSKNDQQDLFYMTCGGMGLTGVITNISLQLIPITTSYIRQKTIRAKNLTTIMNYFETYQDWTYSVAWIDCLASGDSLGRSVLMLGEHAKVNELSKKKAKNPFYPIDKRRKTIPFFMPNWLLNSWSVQLFNSIYYHLSPQSESEKITDYDSFFYPLDYILHWNKLYGKRGFTQYQCVIPLEESKAGLTELLQTISKHKQGSFLAVLKRFGKESLPCLSFPMEGYTLALDFPMTNTACSLMTELDTIVHKYNGRLYLAKDSRMNASFFKASYKYSNDFQAFKLSIDPYHQFESHQSNRLGV